MWMVPHTLVGIAIVTKVENPALSFPLAYMSHYVLDFIPHWTQHPCFKGKEGLYLFIDFFISLGVGLFFALQYPLFSSQFWIIIAGATLGNMADAIRIPSLLIHGNTKGFKKGKSLYGYLERFHYFIDQGIESNGHRKSHKIFSFLHGKIWVGILTQVLIVIYFLYLLF